MWKNNKGVAPAIVGMIIIMFFIFVLALSIDLFMGAISKQEIQTQIEMAQLYGLVKAVDLDKLTSMDDPGLTVTHSLAKNYFKDHFNELSRGGIVEDVVTLESSSDFIDIKQGVVDGYMFEDGKSREYVAATSKIQYYPIRYFRRNHPIEVKAATRIFIKTYDEMGEDTGETVY